VSYWSAVLICYGDLKWVGYDLNSGFVLKEGDVGGREEKRKRRTGKRRGVAPH